MNAIIWALLTGVVTGGIWIAIVLFRQQRELDEFDPDEIADMERRLAELESVKERMSELEARVEFAERLLISPRDAERSTPH